MATEPEDLFFIKWLQKGQVIRRAGWGIPCCPLHLAGQFCLGEQRKGCIGQVESFQGINTRQPGLPNPWNSSTSGQPFANHLAWQLCNSLPSGANAARETSTVWVLKTLCRHALATLTHSVSKCGSLVSWNSPLHVTCPKTFDGPLVPKNVRELKHYLSSACDRFPAPWHAKKFCATKKKEMVYVHISKQAWWG